MREKTPKVAPQLPKAMNADWYGQAGWKVMNDLIAEFPRNNQIWVENFEVIEELLRRVPAETLIRRFNADCPGWVLKKDADGALYATKQ